MVVAEGAFGEALENSGLVMAEVMSAIQNLLQQTQPIAGVD